MLYTDNAISRHVPPMSKKPKRSEEERERARIHRAEYWRGVSLSKPLVDEIEKWIKDHPEAGYTSLADFLHEAVRLRFQIVKMHGPLKKECFADSTDANFEKKHDSSR